MVSEDGIVVQHYLLEQLDQLVGQVGRHEGLDGHRDVLGVLRLAESRLHHLVDQGPAVRVLGIQNLAPEVRFAATDEVAGLALEEGVLIADLR